MSHSRKNVKILLKHFLKILFKCWNNNLLYKHDKNGFPIEIRMLDFQLMRYASPATDLGYYIFGCTTKEMRNEYFQEFLDVYYKTLENFIERYEVDEFK